MTARAEVVPVPTKTVEDDARALLASFEDHQKPWWSQVSKSMLVALLTVSACGGDAGGDLFSEGGMNSAAGGSPRSPWGSSSAARSAT